MGPLLLVIRTAAVFLVYPVFAVIGVGIHSLFFLPRRRRRTWIAYFTRSWARWSCRIFNIRVRVVGDLPRDPNALLISNHVGTPDIFVMGSCFQAFFVSKAEIGRWPLLSWLVRLGETIFAERERRQQVKEIVVKVRQRLEEGHSVILFPEARATDGTDVIPFKSAPFEAATLAERPVLPVTVIYHDDRTPSVACWLNTSYFRHIARLLMVSRLPVTVTVHPAVRETDRRILAEKCYTLIRETLHEGKRRGPGGRQEE